MRYLSVCSGIEAATAAWHNLGWTPAAFSEIEPFPVAVLQHHYPAVPVHGDFTTIKGDEYGSINLLVGGTPCQSFSLAGLRKGLADERGNLTLEFVRLAQRTRPRWLVWENVPGVLSIDDGRAFASFLGGLAELGYGFAYRILDAQYFGVPQRRRRVFVVGCLGDWRAAAAVLFERESLRGDITPRREARQVVTPTIRSGASNGGKGHGARSGDSKDELIIPVANPLGSHKSCRLDLDNDTYVVSTLEAATGRSRGAGTPHSMLVPEVANCLETTCNDYSRADGFNMVIETAPTLDGRSGRSGANNFAGSGGLVAHTLRGEGFDASEDGTGRGVPIVAFAQNQRDEVRTMEVAGALAAEPGMKQQTYVAAFKGGQGAAAGGIGYDEHVAPTLSSAESGTNRTPTLMQQMAVRRLTPRECERLQGFPDDYTRILFRGRSASDGARYKALGNSMAVPVMRWIGERIALIDGLAEVPEKSE